MNNVRKSLFSQVGSVEGLIKSQGEIAKHYAKQLLIPGSAAYELLNSWEKFLVDYKRTNLKLDQFLPILYETTHKNEGPDNPTYSDFKNKYYIAQNLNSQKIIDTKTMIENFCRKTIKNDKDLIKKIPLTHFVHRGKHIEGKDMEPSEIIQSILIQKKLKNLNLSTGAASQTGICAGSTLGGDVIVECLTNKKQGNFVIFYPENVENLIMSQSTHADGDAVTWVDKSDFLIINPIIAVINNEIKILAPDKIQEIKNNIETNRSIKLLELSGLLMLLQSHGAIFKHGNQRRSIEEIFNEKDINVGSLIEQAVNQIDEACSIIDTKHYDFDIFKYQAKKYSETLNLLQKDLQVIDNSLENLQKITQGSDLSEKKIMQHKV